MIEIRNELDQVIDRGYGWKEPNRGYVLTSALDNEEKVYDTDNMDSDFLSIGYLSNREATSYDKYYFIVKNDVIFTQKDLEYIHFSERVTQNSILELKILRELKYNDINTFEEINDLSDFISRYFKFIDTKHKEAIDRIEKLISTEEDEEVKSEYQLILADLNDSVEDFKKVANEEILTPWDSVFHWPTLLNPSPFQTFRNDLNT